MSMADPHTERKRRDSVAFHGSLLRQEQGAIMVVGLFMAVFLVGGIWYVVGIGEAIVFKEKLQDASDAVAYTGAIHHAIGMEQLVMLNLLMAMLLSSLVAMRLVQLSLWGAMAIHCPLFFLVEPLAVCLAANSAEKAVDSMAQATNRGLEATLPALNQMSTIAAQTLPLMAEAQALSAADQFPDVTVLVRSPSLPLQGLPVEDQPMRLCAEATRFGMPAHGNAFQGGASQLQGPVNGGTEAFLCMGRGQCQNARMCPDALMPNLPNAQISSTAIDSSCSRAYAQCCNSSGPRPASCPAACDASARRDFVRNCRFEVARASNMPGNPNQAQSPASNQQASVKCEAPKQLVCESTAGDDHFQLRAFAIGDQPPESGKSGVDVAAHGLDETEELEDYGGMAFAQAEYYFDAPSWGPASMWEFNWRARLRRFRFPVEPGTLPSPAPSSASSTGSGATSGPPSSSSASSNLPGLGYQIPDLTPTLGTQVSRTFKSYARCAEACPPRQERATRYLLSCEQRCANRYLDAPYEIIH